jgi:putative lipoic acid-binding regulatory protein
VSGPEQIPPAQGDPRERAIALLEATHTFPCSYELSIIALNAEEVTVAVGRTVAFGREASATRATAEVESRGGKYVSHRFSVSCQSAEDVLVLYERVRAVKGVITVL